MKDNIMNEGCDEATVKYIKENLDSAKKNIEACLTMSLDEINKNKSCEKFFIDLWSSYFQDLNSHLIRESERTNNNQIYKNIIKHMMFRR